ncbi:uncharacterized protein KY384_000443 [Bacidia gigantensis]|uniref:uncharacterized protein n=1 Tax=Bacidia gigantensis TaxID=2732470 RepID=UPI001D049638|nr:uncharacterized protein KY384_000443 [Bacidia gigantensis]KAG8525683.1 hypothetical protein KY384_000443 [Bacidia gigantensis]
MKRPDRQKPALRMLMELFKYGKSGWELGLDGLGKRTSKDQSNFRKKLIKVCKSTFNGSNNHMWCPIEQYMVTKSGMKAAHIFPWKHGRNAMDCLFATSNEMFSPLNGIMMGEQAEDRFDRGYLCLVPAVNDIRSKQNVNNWLQGRQEYKIMTFQRKISLMQNKICNGPFAGRTWASLDGELVKFSSDHRPRARYLYFHHLFCCHRAAWDASNFMEFKGDALKDHFGAQYWGTAGTYITECFLRGFVLEIGHEHEHLLDHAIKDGDSKPDYTMSSLMRNASYKEEGGESETDEEDEEEEEDDEEESGTEGEEEWTGFNT